MSLQVFQSTNSRDKIHLDTLKVPASPPRKINEGNLAKPDRYKSADPLLAKFVVRPAYRYLARARVSKPSCAYWSDGCGCFSKYHIHEYNQQGWEAGVSQLVRCLKRRDVGIRLNAVSELKWKGRRARVAVPHLIYLLRKERNFLVRYEVVKALGKIGGRRAVYTLIKLLKDKDLNAGAASALGEIKDWRAAGALITALRDTESVVRMNAADALGKMRFRGAVTALVKLLKDSDAVVRQVVAGVLGVIGDYRAVLALLVMMKSDSDNGTSHGGSPRSSARFALTKIKDRRATKYFIDALQDRFERVRTTAAEALGNIGARQAVMPLIVTSLRDSSAGARASAVWSLGEIKDRRAVRALIELLHDEDDGVRGSAVWALGEIKDKAAIPQLLITLRHRDAFLGKPDTAESLRKIFGANRLRGMCTSRTPIRSCLLSPLFSLHKGQVRRVTKRGQTIMPQLVKHLADKNEHIRANAAWVLGRIGSRDHSAPFVLSAAMLLDGDARVRAEAAWALGRIGDWRTALFFFPLMFIENDWRIRKIAVRALAKIKNGLALVPLVVALHDRSRHVRRSAARALGENRSNLAVPSLIATLRDKDWTVRGEAARALGKIGDGRAASRLLEMIAENEKYGWRYTFISAEAGRALNVMKDEKTMHACIAALKHKDWHVRDKAAVVLGNIGDRRAVPYLIEALEDDTWQVVWMAVVALGEIKDRRAMKSLLEAANRNDESYFIKNAVAHALRELGY